MFKLAQVKGNVRGSELVWQQEGEQIISPDDKLIMVNETFIRIEFLNSCIGVLGWRPACMPKWREHSVTPLNTGPTVPLQTKRSALTVWRCSLPRGRQLSAKESTSSASDNVVVLEDCMTEHCIELCKSWGCLAWQTVCAKVARMGNAHVRRNTKNNCKLSGRCTDDWQGDHKYKICNNYQVSFDLANFI